MMQEKWKEFSLYKQGLILIVIAFVLFNFSSHLGALLGLFSRFMSILTPFIIGAFIAYFLSRPVMKLERKFKKSRTRFMRKKASVLSVIAVFVLVILVVTLIASYVAPIIVRNLVDFIEHVPNYYLDTLNWMRGMGEDHWLYNLLPDIPENPTDLINNETGLINSGVLSFITGALDTILSSVVTVTTGVMNFAMGMIVALYLLLYRPLVLGLVNRIATAFIKPKPLAFLKSYVRKSNEVFYKFISAQFLDACILGTLATIMLALLRVEYAVTLGLLLGICNMIPFFGSIFASLVATVVTLFTGGFQQAIILLGALLVLQQIDANFIGPKITGDALGLNPLLIVTSIFIGGHLLGIVGMFIAVPVAAMCRIFLDDYLTIRERKLGIRSD